MRNIGLLSGRVKKTPATNVAPDRYSFLDLKNAEPDLGVPSADNGMMISSALGARSWLQIGTGLTIDNGNLIVDSIVTDSTIDGQGSAADPLSVGQGVRPTDNVTFNDVIVDGDLVVNGTTTTINTQTLEVEDSVIVLAKNQTTPLADIGLLFQRYDPATTVNYNVGMIWDETDDRLIFGSTAENGNDSDVEFDNEWLTITSDGKIGIGTSDPQEALHVEGAIRLDGSYSIDSGSVVLSTTTQTEISNFDATIYGGGKFLIHVYDFVTNDRHIAEITVVHDTVTAIGSEYGCIFTSNPLADFDVSLTGGTVSLLATGASTNSTRYKIQKTLFLL